ncbi:hypothetical protein [Streptomyces syringium]|uniref:hypothetical protein n=1 Tax=Streptomyces syringium TaxID=76729 RepID=UPI00345548AF
MNPLIVPVKVDALMVNEATVKDSHFQRWTPTPASLAAHDNPEPGQLINFGSDDDQGIYLQWTLPRALRTAYPADPELPGEEPRFPCAPNRWLILRHSRARSASATAKVAGWVISSDRVTPADDSFSEAVGDRLPSQIPDFENLDNNGYPGTRWTGFCTPLADAAPPTDDPTAPQWLTANSARLTWFSAYQPYNENIFSFHDTRDDLIAAQPTSPGAEGNGITVSYLVVGWYTNPSYDILNPGSTPALQEVLNALGWDPGTTDLTSIGRRSLYAGTTVGIPWHQTKNLDEYDDLPGTTAGYLFSVGRNSVDALIAKLAKHDKFTKEELSYAEAFEYNLLPFLNDNPSPTALAYATHAACFTALPGGLQWRIDNKIPSSNTGASLKQSESELLAKLNAAQADCEVAVSRKRNTIDRLKGLWWTEKPGEEQAGTQDELKVLANTAAAYAKECEETRKQIPDVTDEAIGKWLSANKIDTTRTLRPVAVPPFWKNQDPVILLHGVQKKALAPENFPPGPLRCRPLGQLLAHGTKRRLDTGEENLTKAVPEDLTAAVEALRIEFDELATTADSLMLDGRIADLTKKIEETRQGGTIPAFLQEWRQPWTPLFLEWAADVYPTTAKDYSFDFEHGVYRRNEAASPEAVPAGPAPLTLRGYAPLAPLLHDLTRYRAALHASRSPEEKEKVDKIITHINEAGNSLSATLDGLNAALAARRTDLTFPVTPTGIDPAISPWLRHPSDSGLPLPEAPFNFIRTGQFRLQELSVIDTFGRALEFLDRANNDPIRYADSMAVTTLGRATNKVEESRLFELPPRLHQPARLRFDYITTDTTAAPIGTDPNANPVYGWILITTSGHRQSLLIYSPTGQALGELHTLDSNSNTASWRPLPGSPYNANALDNNSAFATSYPTLHAFLTKLHTTPQALTALITSLSTSFCSIDPPTPQGPESRPLTLLIGRPCALLRARLRLELNGPTLGPATHEELYSPTATALPQWSTRLGDARLLNDGLLGYYLNQDFTKIHTLHPAGPQNDPHGYTTASTPTDITLSAQPPGTGSDTRLTILACPYSTIHAVTDIVPATALALPTHFTDTALANIKPSLAAGPVLAPTDTDGRILMPRPYLATHQGTWTWQQITAGSSWTPYDIAPDQPTAMAPGPVPEARTGYLQLAPGPL